MVCPNAGGSKKRNSEEPKAVHRSQSPHRSPPYPVGEGVGTDAETPGIPSSGSSLSRISSTKKTWARSRDCHLKAHHDFKVSAAFSDEIVETSVDVLERDLTNADPNGTIEFIHASEHVIEIEVVPRSVHQSSPERREARGLSRRSQLRTDRPSLDDDRRTQESAANPSSKPTTSSRCRPATILRRAGWNRVVETPMDWVANTGQEASSFISKLCWPVGLH